MKQYLPDIQAGYALDKNTFGELAFVVPEESTNLITEPSMDSAAGYFVNNGTLSGVSSEQKFGYSSLKVTRTNPGSFYVYRNINLASSNSFTFSVYVKAAKASRINLRIEDNTHFVKMTEKKFIANGDWQRLILTFGTLSGPTLQYSVIVDCVYSNPGYFYTDAWQLENKPYATTWFCGETLLMKNLDNPSAYKWNGPGYFSTSTRSVYTRDGGKIVKLSDIGIHLVSIGGLGFRGVQNNITTLNDGTGFFDGSIQTQRQFTITLQIYGKSYQDVVRKNTLLRQCIYSETSGNKEINKILIFQYDEYGQQAKEIELRCYFAGSVETEINNMYQKKIVLIYDMPIPSIFETGNYAVDLYFKTALTVNYVTKMDSNGLWSNMDSGFNGKVYDIIETPDGNVWACGDFTTANGVQCRRVAYWNGALWTEAAAITAGSVYCMETDGTFVWIGGNFVFSGNTFGIAKIDISTLNFSIFPNPTIGPTVLALCYDIRYNTMLIGGTFTGNGEYDNSEGGGGISSIHVGTGIISNLHGIPSGYVSGICIGVDGFLYITGSFSAINHGIGDISAIDLAMNGNSGWQNIGNLAGSGYGHRGNVIKLGPDGNIYLGGVFTSVGGVVTSNLAKRVGSTWTKLVTTTPMYTRGGSPLAVVSPIQASTGTAEVFDIDWNQYGIMYVVGRFDYVVGREHPESIALYYSGSFSPTTIKTNQVPVDTIYAVMVSHSNEVYLGLDHSSSAVVCGAVISGVQEDVYPSLVIRGPGKLSSIINQTNGKSIWFNDLTLNYNEVFAVIFSPYGTTYLSSINRDIASYVVGGSDVDFKLSKGLNTISLFIYNGDTADTLAYMLVDRIYDGIEATANVSV